MRLPVKSAVFLAVFLTAPSILLAQSAKDQPKASAKPAQKSAPVSNAPEKTSATFADWLMRCDKTETVRVCEVAQVMSVQGQSNPIAQVAIGAAKSDQPKQLTLMLPANVYLPAKAVVSTAQTPPAKLELTWQRCTPGACFASAAIADDLIKSMSAQTEPGRIAFINAVGQEMALPLSFRGLSQALGALAKEP